MITSVHVNLYTKVILILFSIHFVFAIRNSGDLFTDLFQAISKALVASGAEEKLNRQHQDVKDSSGISFSVYNALESITKNDDSECVSRLLCEVAAGGNPGGSRQINFDKYSLSKLISYLQLDPTHSSPMLVFSKALALGISNRGDPYSCIINYPKCPKDQDRLLYYLNNHRGGLFRFFNWKLPHQYHHYGQYPVNYKPHYYNSRKPNHGLFRDKKRDNKVGLYAKEYGYTGVTFPVGQSVLGNEGGEKILFPRESEGRIQTKVVGLNPTRSSRENTLVFSNSQRKGKKVKNDNFFPYDGNSVSKPAVLATDRLPNKFYFPLNEKVHQMKFPSASVLGLFFPKD